DPAWASFLRAASIARRGRRRPFWLLHSGPPCTQPLPKSVRCGCDTSGRTGCRCGRLLPRMTCPLLPRRRCVRQPGQNHPYVHRCERACERDVPRSAPAFPVDWRLAALFPDWAMLPAHECNSDWLPHDSDRAPGPIRERSRSLPCARPVFHRRSTAARDLDSSNSRRTLLLRPGPPDTSAKEFAFPSHRYSQAFCNLALLRSNSEASALLHNPVRRAARFPIASKLSGSFRRQSFLFLRLRPGYNLALPPSQFPKEASGTSDRVPPPFETPAPLLRG